METQLTIIMISKSNKPKHLVTTYRLIRELPIFGKLFEKRLLKCITIKIHENNILPQSQLDFRSIKLQITDHKSNINLSRDK